MNDTPREPELLTHISEGVGIITLNRPHRRNALNPNLLNLLTDAVKAMAADDAVKVVVLTGAGGAFCSGGDMKGDPTDPDVPRRGLGENMEAARLLHTMPKPTIAMVGGAAAGAGLSLAASCDLRFASEDAVFLAAFSKVGLSGDYGGTYFWTRMIGSARTRQLYLMNEKLTAKQALDWGMVNYVYPADKLEEETMAVAKQLAEGPTPVLAFVKENLNVAEDAALDTVFALEVRNMERSRLAMAELIKQRRREREKA